MKLDSRGLNAFSLVEVTLALGVAAVSLIAIFGLLPVGLQANRTATQQTMSSDIVSGVLADLRATPVTTPRGGAATSPQFGIAIPANPVGANTTTTLYFSTEGKFTTSLTSVSRYKAVITIVPNTGVRAATLADLKMSWPAAAANPEGSAEFFAAFDRN